MIDNRIPCACGQRYWPNQAWIHKSHATNTESATNKVRLTNEPVVAAERVVQVELGRGLDGPPMVSQVGPGLCGDVARTANRRNKEAYNAYQREYMRKKRAKAAASV